MLHHNHRLMLVLIQHIRNQSSLSMPWRRHRKRSSRLKATTSRSSMRFCRRSSRINNSETPSTTEWRSQTKWKCLTKTLNSKQCSNTWSSPRGSMMKGSKAPLNTLTMRSWPPKCKRTHTSRMSKQPLNPLQRVWGGWFNRNNFYRLVSPNRELKIFC